MSSTGRVFTEAEKARMERNRIKALHLRQAKLVAHPYQKKNVNSADGEESVIKVQGTKYIDSGGGFLLEQPVISTNGQAITAGKEISDSNTEAAKVLNDALSIPVTFEECLDCGDAFVESYLFSNFGHAVCDKCRDQDGRHALITRTEAKAEYLLKDCDFDRREPPLRYISRKNPHNVRWGEMKLYLLLQVERRAMEVWGSEEELSRQHELLEEKREVTKVKKYNKQMKQLRMEMRSSLFTKETKSTHEHEFGADTYNEEDDNYTHTCLKCPYTETYEKM
ncbi:DNA repair protein complementing XP-A cells homolog [Anastrepha obliqua]|uniref:DNA repair protein complementing XP-A cells homolog n=1 Tax=Anastrepha obliqua TaxID=95512 RepID=UPI002409A5E2|nr:DNA repair protein complementing XP-A cells homolog [Anastrepha obliqua]XP_054740588.1 DNA repair protein complementing XP-A cells homolog [Anastrepha obliqua]